MQEADTPEKPCRHEYVKIYQRRLKGLDRRLVSTRAYLPTGFKLGDFGHLSEGSYCFCTKCRTRLFPKRTNAERAQARQAALESKQADAELENLERLELEQDQDQENNEVQLKDGQDVQIEELVTESADIEASDIEEGSDVQEEED